MVQSLDEEMNEFEIEMGEGTNFSLRDIKRILTAEMPTGKLGRRHFMPLIGFPLYLAEDLGSRIIKRLLKESNNYDCLNTARDVIMMREAQFVLGPVAGSCFLLGYKICPLLF